MTDRVAWLRGMNVGGHRLTNAALVQAFESMGIERIRTYRASGNVIFADPGWDDLSQRIETGLAERLGYAVPTLLATAAEVRTVATATPFSAARLAATAGKIQVTWLAAAPTLPVRQTVLAMATEDDTLTFADGVLYWLPVAGIRTSALDWTRLQRILEPCTTRTLNTVRGVAAKLSH